jgi:hypothetical protein
VLAMVSFSADDEKRCRDGQYLVVIHVEG